MKTSYSILLMYLLLGVASCDVHEFPTPPERMPLHLRKIFDIKMTEMTEWNHLYDGKGMTEIGMGETYDNTHEYGRMRYIVRAYPVMKNNRSTQEFAEEFVFSKDIADGYDHDVSLYLPPGDYNIMVWADMVERNGDLPFYNVENFSEITLQGTHQGNINHRDAFSGNKPITIEGGIMEREPDTLEIDMLRPLAKFEFITTDLSAFLDKEMDYLAKEAQTRGEEPPTRIDTDNYKVVIYYAGFMPDTYNMHIDRPVDASTGVLFESGLNVLNEEEASLGFDYVFVDDRESVVTVQIGVYDNEDRQLALTNPIDVPLRRNHHTIVRGSFLLQEVSGGLVINPEFEGNHNVIIPNR